ncbi:uncharacterized protein ARMOST_19825 [Armillaria ostoyae]|uniref:Uncharacterized protein n=1 Tax=Armillaria ostoyae TaxID=47428 RepID=A0A284S5L6_ARMOS|nr:uncharacterized protein ARMOST_19825 [Armillaria ostoyae]
MQTVIDQFGNNWGDILELHHQLEPPPFVPLVPNNAVTNIKRANHGARLVCPANGTLDEWCQYAAHHFRPGGHSTPIGIGMDTASRVSYPHMWGYLLSLMMAPITEQNGIQGLYFCLFAGIVACPQWYFTCMNMLNAEQPSLGIQVAPLGNTFAQLKWDTHAANLNEDDII